MTCPPMVFKSRSTACRWIRGFLHSRPIGWPVYRCVPCGGWHVGSRATYGLYKPGAR